MGITHRRAVLIIYGVSVVLCLGAIGIALGRSWEVGAAILCVSTVLFGLIRFIGYFEYLALVSRQKQQIRSRHVEWMRRLVFQLPPRFESAATEAELLSMLSWVATQARLDYAELERPDGTKTRFSGDDYKDMDARDVSSTRFPLGKNGYYLAFGWRSEYGDVPPQMEILLELVVDAVSARLEGLNSPITRAVTPAEVPAARLATPARSAS
jgi:UDP-GlcNAc:undecaprenyl-phosphate GlcNAc-1-phosphate transferase